MKIGSVITTDLGAAYSYLKYGRLQELISKTTDPKILNFLELIRKLQVDVEYFLNREVCCGIDTMKAPERWLISFLLLRKKDVQGREVFNFTFLTGEAVDLDRLPEKFDKSQLLELIMSEIISHLFKLAVNLQKKLKEAETRKSNHS